MSAYDPKQTFAYRETRRLLNDARGRSNTTAPLFGARSYFSIR